MPSCLLSSPWREGECVGQQLEEGRGGVDNDQLIYIDHAGFVEMMSLLMLLPDIHVCCQWISSGLAPFLKFIS